MCLTFYTIELEGNKTAVSATWPVSKTNIIWDQTIRTKIIFDRKKYKIWEHWVATGNMGVLCVKMFGNNILSLSNDVNKNKILHIFNGGGGV